ncbi:helix-turn-helix domain-containing protein [Cryobacterium sp. MDB2-33-2]|uniref:helix-turn-helix domain-containing protein n=1 Tax=Cryobacterium sp. MDB2-33-2 TaxID=1259179 RepID=UPI00106A5C41|nr:helix-turn-helix domain-containing protein [Cryobacterium sp. MDB2-33-2]TFC02725.1 DNA-binding protein [Cryobacterium sp. MDB2-33-2]
MMDGTFDVSALDDLFEDLPKTLTPEQAAELFGVSVVTVRKLITNQEAGDPLPAIKFGKAWVILRDDFKAWLLRRSNNITD